jgi:hypothetical protein
MRFSDKDDKSNLSVSWSYLMKLLISLITQHPTTDGLMGNESEVVASSKEIPMLAFARRDYGKTTTSVRIVALRVDILTRDS